MESEDRCERAGERAIEVGALTDEYGGDDDLPA
jgi:hypothetical protein